MNRWVSCRAVAALAAALVIAAVAPAATAASAPAPREVVQAVIDEGLRILQRDDLSVGVKREQLQAMVEQYFDFETLSKLVLAQNWRKLSKEQRRAFTDVFKTHLALTYSKNIAEYDDESAVIVGEQEEARGDRTVKSKILRTSAEDVFVNYRLRQRDGAWMMIDVVVEGVSLVSNWRAQFREVLGNKSPERLIELLEEKNEKLRQES
jgi:phospholipid transport system substrate-binding protein